MSMLRYQRPLNWLNYDRLGLLTDLAEAKGAVIGLRSLPFQESWAAALQEVQLKREVAGTSRIEGAEFTEGELDVALRESSDDLISRSQRQARAAVQTYRWIATVPDDRPLDANLILEVHRRIVAGADDDHCPPGRLRERDQNVSFGSPLHRGVEGGTECADVFAALCQAIQGSFRDHDPLIQALALHYHLAAMHPFLDGNGRSARALEALLLQRAGLRDTLFVAMSNYYYEETASYLTALADTAAAGHDLSVFLRFGLRGVVRQCSRLTAQIRLHLDRSLFRDLMYRLFGRLKTPKRRVIAQRQIEILKLLLKAEALTLEELQRHTEAAYRQLKFPERAFFRDLQELRTLGAVRAERTETGWVLNARLDWPSKITTTKFLENLKTLPRDKTHSFLS